MSIEVFNRFENKYLINQEVCYMLQTRLSEYMKPDEYALQNEMYTISNLYYDTPDSHLIRTSLQKPYYKEKLRVRSYGVPEINDLVFVEVKKKVAGLVNKRRSALLLKDAYKFLNSGEFPIEQPCQNRQVLSEILYMLQTFNLQPMLYLAYDRKAFFSIDDSAVRISFDCNIRTRRYDLKLESGDYGSKLLNDDQWLVEIKSANNIPLWLSATLAEMKLYPTSFSKYGMEYMNTILRKDTKTYYSYNHPIAAAQYKTAVAV